MSKDLKLLDLKEELKNRKKYAGYDPKASKEDYLSMMGVRKDEQCVLKLNDKQIAFCLEMVHNGMDKVAAYKTVYNPPELTRSVYAKIATLMRNEDVRELLRLGVKRHMGDVMDNLDSTLLDTYVTRAFFDPADFLTDDGEPKPLSDIPEELRCVIDGVEKKYYGKDADVCTVTLKLANRDTALKVLGEYVNGLTRKDSVPVTASTDKAGEDMTNKYSMMSDDDLLNEMAKIG